MNERLTAVQLYGYDDINTVSSDPQFGRGLSIIRRGIKEVAYLNGPEMTDHELEKYTPQRGFEEYWKGQVESGRQPFLAVGWNNMLGDVAAMEGRFYTYKGTQDPAVFINWIATRIKRVGIGTEFYRHVEGIAQQRGTRLLIAGIHQGNEPSQKLHDKVGFVKEVSDKAEPFATERGAFIPPYQLDEGRGAIEFYTKRV